MFDLVIRGDQVVTPHGVGAFDIGIQGETIAAVARHGTLMGANAGRVIDATGRIVIPGGIDPHIHCKWQSPGNQYFSAPPIHVSRAALFGGTTMFVDFAIWRNGETLQESIEKRESDWRGQCHCDYAYHVLLNGQIPLDILEQIPETIQAGFPSFKLYTTDGRPQRSGWKLDFGDIWEVLKVLAGNRGIACIHAEDNDIVMHMYRKLYREGRTGFENMAEVHSALSEDLSFRRIIRLAENVEGAALYMMHTSASSGVQAIEESRRKGYPIYGETLHQYALFTREDYNRPNGQIYHTYPSLKDEEDQTALWDGMTRSGAISTIATDGICTPLALKIKGKKIDDVLGGNAGVEPRVGVIYTEMVEKRRCSLEQFVNVVSANASRIMGLYPRKGALAVGSDADITILDASAKHTLREEDLHESDYSPWAGYEVAAWPVLTVLRGKIVVEKGRFYGKAEDGKRIERKLSDAILSGPYC
jgi:dihydropyrimidinase